MFIKEVNMELFQRDFDKLRRDRIQAHKEHKSIHPSQAVKESKERHYEKFEIDRKTENKVHHSDFLLLNNHRYSIQETYRNANQQTNTYHLSQRIHVYICVCAIHHVSFVSTFTGTYPRNPEHHIGTGRPGLDTLFIRAISLSFGSGFVSETLSPPSI
jgi:hypothetical protein